LKGVSVDFSIQSLATIVARRARGARVRPPLVVDAVLREHGIEDNDVRSLVLRECGRRGGKAQRKKTTWKEHLGIFAEIRKQRIVREMRERAEEANEHICPID
jgi:hypothetical protein